MKLKISKFISMTASLLLLTSVANADIFFRVGNINAVMTDSKFYGGCMVRIDTNIANGCPDDGWVSLDCNNTYFSDGKSKLATILTARSLNKVIGIQVDNTKKHNGYCVADRLVFY